MKIMLVITGLSVGGAERLVTALADRYSSLGNEVLLVRFHGEVDLGPANPKVKMVNLDMRRTPLGVLIAMCRFRRLILDFHPDVVNSHLVHANILTRLLRLVTPMPSLISSAHNTNEEGCLRMVAYRLTDRLANISTNVSAEAVRAFEKQRALRPGRMVSIHNGIDAQHFKFNGDARNQLRKELGVDEFTSLLLAVGRLREEKDYPSLLKAFSEIGVGCGNFHLAIVGAGPLGNDLRALADSLGVTDRLSFLGVRHDVPALMCASDLFVLSSAWEGFGLVVAEAMACERVVVATNCGGVKEVVGDVGYLVQPLDSNALAESLKSALALSVEEKCRLGRLARQRVIERFSLEATADRYLALYNHSISALPDGSA